MSSSKNATESVLELTAPGGALDLGPDRARLLVGMLRLLADGRPVTSAQAGAAVGELGVDRAAALAFLDAWTERNDAGDIVGLGLTYIPTPHRVGLGQATAWTWCAMDTLIFAIVLGRKLTVESAGPGGGGTVELVVGPGGISDARPADAVVTWPARTNAEVDISSMTAIWGTFCHHSFFFPSQELAERWASGRDDIRILSMSAGFEVAGHVAAAMLRYQPRVSAST